MSYSMYSTKKACYKGSLIITQESYWAYCLLTLTQLWLHAQVCAHSGNVMRLNSMTPSSVKALCMTRKGAHFAKMTKVNGDVLS